MRVTSIHSGIVATQRGLSRPKPAKQTAPRTISLDTAARIMADEPTDRWSQPVPFCLTNRPATDAEGRLFLSAGGGIQRHDPESGETSWRFTRDHKGMSDPVFLPDGSLAVVGDFTRLYVLDRETGTLQHEVPLDRTVAGRPAPGPNGTLVMTSFADGMLNHNSAIYSLDPDEAVPAPSLGRKLWKLLPFSLKHGTQHRWEVPINSDARGLMDSMLMTPAGELHSLATSPSGGKAYVVSAPGELSAVDGDSGEVRWQRRLEVEALYSPLTLQDGSVVVASPQELFGLDPEDGELLWRCAADGVIFSQPTADQAGRVFFHTGLGKLNCLQDGSIQWGKKGGFSTRYPPVADAAGNVYAVKDDVLVALDGETGTEIFHLKSPGKVTSSPSLQKDGTLVVKIADGRRERLVSLLSPFSEQTRVADTPGIVKGTGWVRVGGVKLKVRS